MNINDVHIQGASDENSTTQDIKEIRTELIKQAEKHKKTSEKRTMHK